MTTTTDDERTDTAQPAPAAFVEVPLARIILDTDLCQLRQHRDTHVIPGVDETRARGYAKAMEAGSRFPPLLVGDLSDVADTLLLIDGHHRYRALQIIGAQRCAVARYRVTKDEAVVLALKANSSHGRPFADKERNAGIARSVVSGALIPEGCDTVIGLAEHIAKEVGRDGDSIRRLLYRLAAKDPRVAQALERLKPPTEDPPASREQLAAGRAKRRMSTALRYLELASAELEYVQRHEWLHNLPPERQLALLRLRQMANAIGAKGSALELSGEK